MPANFRTTRGLIEYELLPQYTERWTSQGQQEITQFAIVDWDKKDNFITAVMPDVSIGDQMDDPIRITAYCPGRPIVTLPRARLVRLLPQVHPARPLFYVADAVVVQGMGWPGVSGNDITFNEGTAPHTRTGKAIIQITFRTLPYSANLDDAYTNTGGASELLRYVSRRCSTSHKNLPLPGKRLRLYDEQLRPIPATFLESVTKAFSWQHLSWTWHMVPRLPRAAVYYGGKVNEVDFDATDSKILRGHGYPGTVLYLGVTSSDVYSTRSGMQVHDYTFNFLHLLDIAVFSDNAGDKIIGHNHLFSPQFNKFGRAFVYQSLADPDLPAEWGWVHNLAAHAGFIAMVNPPSFSGPIASGFNIYDYVDLNNLFKMDV